LSLINIGYEVPKQLMSLFLRLEIVSISNGGKAAEKKKSKNFYVKLEEKRKL